MSRVRRQSLIVEEKKPKDACSWGLWRSGGDTRRGPLNLTSAKLVGTSQNTGLGGLSGLSSRLNGLRGVVSGMLLAPGVAPSRSPSHADAPSQSGFFPPIFLPTLCHHERCRNWPTGCRHQTVARGKMAQCSSWWCPTRSFASIINANEISALDIIVVGHNPFIFLASARNCLRSTQPRQSTGWRLRYPSTQANFTKIDQAPATWGKLDVAGTPRPLLERGAQQGTHSLLRYNSMNSFGAHATPPVTGSDTQAQTLAFLVIPNPQTPAFVCTSALVYSLFR
jgi:hypothetical protein